MMIYMNVFGCGRRKTTQTSLPCGWVKVVSHLRCPLHFVMTCLITDCQHIAFCHEHAATPAISPCLANFAICPTTADWTLMTWPSEQLFMVNVWLYWRQPTSAKVATPEAQSTRTMSAATQYNELLYHLNVQRSPLILDTIICYSVDFNSISVLW